MRNGKFTFLQQCIQRHRRNASDIASEDDEFEMTPQRKEFLDMLEKMKQEYEGDKK
jgi:hypothetical protein|tara:strand:+ start:7701 stop:7868 length:168 start_codon:yes stop_codon:yes gene_type:complete